MTDLLSEITVGEMLALALAVGPTKFIADPFAILIDMTASCNLIEFYTYLVQAQGLLQSLIGLGQVLHVCDQQDYIEPLKRLRASIPHWLCDSPVFATACNEPCFTWLLT